jgi:predicted ribosome quality control (RQC) complex YloA/Tae2 family protein
VVKGLPKPRFQPSSFDLKILVKELNEKLEGCYLNKIYQINPTTLLLRFTKPGEDKRNLIIESGKRIHLTRYKVEKPLHPPPFCIALRKHLLNARLLSVEQPNLERMVILNFSTRRGKYELLAELFGRGNIVLLDDKNRIVKLLSLGEAGRKLRVGEPYAFPSSGVTKYPLSVEELLEKLKSFRGEVVKALTKIYGLGGIYAEEFLLRAGINKSKNSREITSEEAEKIFEVSSDFLKALDKPNPHLYFNGENKPIAFSPLPLTRFKGLKAKPYSSMNAAVDDFFTNIEALKVKTEEERRVEAKLSELERIALEQTSKLRKLEAEAENLKVKAETVFKHAAEIQALLNLIEKMVNEGLSWKQISSRISRAKAKGEYPLCLCVELNPKDKKVKVSVEGLEAEAFLGKSAYEAASTYYDEAKKVRKKTAKLRQTLNEKLRKISSLKIQVSKLEVKHPKPLEAKKPKWYEKFRFFHTSDGFLVLAGKDSSTNEILIRRYTEPHDLVFHTEIPSSSFVTLRTKGKTPSEDSIRQAAQFTASYSRAWKGELAAVDVYYVKPEQVSKSAPSGQYLPRGSFMVYGGRSYVRGVPLRLALAVKLKDEPDVFAAPLEAAETGGDLIAEIAPGKTKAKILADEIKKLMFKQASKDEKEVIRKIPPEEFSSKIPFGSGEVLRVFRCGK